MQDVGVTYCPTVARGLIVEIKLLLAPAGVLVTLILAQPCEGTAPGKSPLGKQGEGQWRGKCLGLGRLWFHWTLSPFPSEQLPQGSGDLGPSGLYNRGQVAGGCRLQSDSEDVGLGPAWAWEV